MPNSHSQDGHSPPEAGTRLTAVAGAIVATTLTLALVLPGMLAAGYLLLALIATVWLTRHRTWRGGDLAGNESLLLTAMGVFIAVWLIGCAVHGFDEESRRSATRVLRLLPAIPLFLLVRRTPALAPAFHYGLIGGALAACGYALWWVMTGQVGEFEGRVEGPTNPIYFGGVVLIYALMLVPLVADQDRRPAWRALVLVAIVAAFVANALSGSRGVWLAVPLLVGIYFFTLGRQQPPLWRFGTPAVLLALSVAVLTVPFLPLHERVSETWLELDQIGQGLISNGSVGLRWQFWQIAFSVIAEHPLFGAGPGAFHEAIEQAVAAGTADPALLEYDHPHNQYLSALCHFGLPALAAFLFMIVAAVLVAADELRSADRSTRFLAWALTTVVCAMALLAVTESIFERNAGVIWLGLLAALAGGLQGSRRFSR